MRFRSLLFMVLIGFLLSGCSSRDPNRKETFPVTGEVYADGVVAEGVTVELHPVGGIDKAQPTMTSTMTDAEGKFAASTYEQGDGAPEGEYIVTFKWGQLNRMSMSYDGDKFKGKYSDPKKSEFRVSVVAGSPADMGRIELVTK